MEDVQQPIPRESTYVLYMLQRPGPTLDVQAMSIMSPTLAKNLRPILQPYLGSKIPTSTGRPIQVRNLVPIRDVPEISVMCPICDQICNHTGRLRISVLDPIEHR